MSEQVSELEKRADFILLKVLDKLKTLRECRGLSQEAAGEALGISQNTVSRIEVGKTDLKFFMLLHMVLLYRVEPARFFEEVFGQAEVSAVTVIDPREAEGEVIDVTAMQNIPAVGHVAEYLNMVVRATAREWRTRGINLTTVINGAHAGGFYGVTADGDEEE